jgi:hypothetical protein
MSGVDTGWPSFPPHSFMSENHLIQGRAPGSRRQGEYPHNYLRWSHGNIEAFSAKYGTIQCPPWDWLRLLAFITVWPWPQTSLTSSSTSFLTDDSESMPATQLFIDCLLETQPGNFSARKFTNKQRTRRELGCL